MLDCLCGWLAGFGWLVGLLDFELDYVSIDCLLACLSLSFSFSHVRGGTSGLRDFGRSVFFFVLFFFFGVRACELKKVSFFRSKPIIIISFSFSLCSLLTSYVCRSYVVISLSRPAVTIKICGRKQYEEKKMCEPDYVGELTT